MKNEKSTYYDPYEHFKDVFLGLSLGILGTEKILVLERPNLFFVFYLFLKVVIEGLKSDIRVTFSLRI